MCYVVALKGLKGLKVLDSNGHWTLLVEAMAGRFKARAIVPAGSSKGLHEARVVKVDTAVKRVKALSVKLRGESLDCIDPHLVQEPGNVSTGVSMAVHRLMAKVQGLELFQYFGGVTLPRPFFNVINGGLHAGNKLAFQEYMIAPQGKTFREMLEVGARVYQSLREYLIDKHGRASINVGLEGGFAPPMINVEEPLRVIKKVLSDLGLSKKVDLGIDAAASQFFDNDRYVVNNNRLTIDELTVLYQRLVKDYGLVTIEDPFFEEDFDSFARLTNLLKGKARVIGDDLLVSNPSRVKLGVIKAACNCLLLKVNQVGTVSKAMESVRKARAASWEVMVSHRSGDSCDSFISDLAVGLNASMIKSGAPARGERVAKYNRLLEIEELLGGKTRYSSL